MDNQDCIAFLWNAFDNAATVGEQYVIERAIAEIERLRAEIEALRAALNGKE